MEVSSQPPSNSKAAMLESKDDDQHLPEPSVKVKSTQCFISPRLSTAVMSELGTLDERCRQRTPPSRPYGKPGLPKAGAAERQSASEKEVINCITSKDDATRINAPYELH
jgi:hypothetical protein